jgi:hypothetical protein
LWAIGLLSLLAVTYPLWIPSWLLATLGSSDSFPQVPWLAIPVSGAVLQAVDASAFSVLVIVLVGLVWKPDKRILWAAVFATLGTQILLDQQRLQPWAYQSLLYSLVLLGLPWRFAKPCLIAITISIYAYSAAGKFDFQFVHTVGTDIVQALLSPVLEIDGELAARLAFVLPVSELSIALLLCIPKTRRPGGYLVIALHLSLVTLLGPWWLNHSWGVLAWNGLLIAQSGFLFLQRPLELIDSDAAMDADASLIARTDEAVRPLAWIAFAAVGLALIAPLFERTGYWDHWPSWALYSPHNSRAEIQIHRSGTARLPDDLKAYLHPEPGDRWLNLDIETWSLDQRLVPVYPQARYQRQLASRLANAYQLGNAIRVKVKSVSDRFTGEREETYLIGAGELGDASPRW